MANPAEHLAPARFDDRRRIALQGLSKGIIGGEKEPAVAAGLDDRIAGPMREEPGVVDPMNCVRVAFRACKIGSGGTGRQHDLVLLPRRFANREPTAELPPSTITSTLSTSNQELAKLDPTSALFR